MNCDCENLKFREFGHFNYTKMLTKTAHQSTYENECTFLLKCSPHISHTEVTESFPLTCCSGNLCSLSSWPAIGLSSFSTNSRSVSFSIWCVSGKAVNPRLHTASRHTIKNSNIPMTPALSCLDTGQHP